MELSRSKKGFGRPAGVARVFLTCGAKPFWKSSSSSLTDSLISSIVILRCYREQQKNIIIVFLNLKSIKYAN